MVKFISEIDFSPLWISMKTGVVATSVSFILGIVMARIVMSLSPKKRALADTVLTLPLVLPPTVAGYILLMIFSVKRPVGAFLEGNNIRVVQTWLGCVLAAVVIAFPLMYRNARAAFELVDINLIYAARTLGMSEFSIFTKVIMPVAKPGIMSGIVLTFARAIGEYGATSMLAGNIPGRTGTISQKIAMVMQDGDFALAGFWVLVIIVIAFVIMACINISTGRTMRNVRKW